MLRESTTDYSGRTVDLVGQGNDQEDLVRLHNISKAFALNIMSAVESVGSKPKGGAKTALTTEHETSYIDSRESKLEELKEKIKEFRKEHPGWFEMVTVLLAMAAIALTIWGGNQIESSN